MMKKIRKLLRQQEGFTLVELMVAVVILGILAGIGVQQYGKIQENARKAANAANIRVIKNAAQMYFLVGPGNLEDVPEDEPAKLDVETLVEAGFIDAVPQSPWEDDQEYQIEVEVVNNNVVIKVYLPGHTDPENGTDPTDPENGTDPKIG